MPRYPSKPETWKPTETAVTVPDVGTITCVAVFDHSEDEDRTGSTWHDGGPGGGQWVKNQRTHWTVTATFEGQTITSPFSQGSAFDRPPTARDVLSSLVMDASCADEPTFEDFCSSLGYDSDSRTAERIWHACRDTELQLRRMFGAKYEDLQKWGYEQ